MVEVTDTLRLLFDYEIKFFISLQRTQSKIRE